MDFLRKTELAVLLGLYDGVGRTQQFLQYAILFDTSKNRSKFQDCTLNVLINYKPKTFLLSSQSGLKPKHVCHYDFARDDNRLSTTYSLTVPERYIDHILWYCTCTV